MKKIRWITTLSIFSLLLSAWQINKNNEIKNILKNGWSDVLTLKNTSFAEHSSKEEAINTFKSAVKGKRIQLEGYVKQVQPHFSKEKDYYFSKSIESDCLPFYIADEYCGHTDTTYLRVLFNGIGKEDKDFDILFKPHRNKYVNSKEKLNETVLDGGNYKVYTTNQKYKLQATVKFGAIKCLSADCTTNTATIHIDDWSFLINE